MGTLSPCLAWRHRSQSGAMNTSTLIGLRLFTEYDHLPVQHGVLGLGSGSSLFGPPLFDPIVRIVNDEHGAVTGDRHGDGLFELARSLAFLPECR